MTTTPSTTRFRAALATLHWSAAALASEIGCSQGLCEKWRRTGASADVLDYVETLVWVMKRVPVPRVNTTAGRRRVAAE